MASETALNPGDDVEPDGLTNLQEYQRETNPNNADSFLLQEDSR